MTTKDVVKPGLSDWEIVRDELIEARELSELLDADLDTFTTAWYTEEEDNADNWSMD